MSSGAESGSGWAYLARRLLMLPPILLVVTVLTFLIAHQVPPETRAKSAMDKHISPAKIAEIIKEQGWDRPALEQYVRYLGGLLKGDLGISIVNSGPVAEDIANKFPATAELALLSMLIACSCGLALGVLSAVGRNTWVDYSSMVVALVGVSIPVFWLALLVKGFISETLSMPLLGRGRVEDVVTGFYLIDSLLAGDLSLFADCLRRLIVPAAVLATVPMAIITRITRASMLDVLGSDYIRTARAKGLAQTTVVMRHALKNASLPILTIAGMQLGYLLGGAVLTETIFNWQGLGSYVAEAILSNDFAPVQGGVLVMATAFVVVNLLVDLTYALLDPRVRIG